MRIESRARARALQALYAWEMRGEKNLDRVATQVWDDLAVSPEERRIAGLLVREVAKAGTALEGSHRRLHFFDRTNAGRGSRWLALDEPNGGSGHRDTRRC